MMLLASRPLVNEKVKIAHVKFRLLIKREFSNMKIVSAHDYILGSCLNEGTLHMTRGSNIECVFQSET